MSWTRQWIGGIVFVAYLLVAGFSGGVWTAWDWPHDVPSSPVRALAALAWPVSWAVYLGQQVAR